MGDPLLDMAVSVEYRYDASPDDVWAILTDVPRMATLSPEVVETAWVDAAAFVATNRRGGMEWTVTCHVLEVVHPTTFAWCVSDPGCRSSTWSYQLAPEGSGTRVRQEFRHGPGMSMVRRAIERGADPADVIASRSRMLTADMNGVLAAVDKLLTDPPTSPP